MPAAEAAQLEESGLPEHSTQTAPSKIQRRNWLQVWGRWKKWGFELILRLKITLGEIGCKWAGWAAGTLSG